MTAKHPRAAVCGHALAIAFVALGSWGGALVVDPTPARAWCQLTTEEPAGDPLDCADGGLPLAWRRGQLSYSFLDTPPATIPRADAETTFDESFDTWLGLACDGAGHGFQVVQGPDASCDQPFHDTGGPNSHAIIFARDWADRGYPDSALANTTIWFRPSSGEILDVDMELNEETRDFEICPDQGCRARGRLVDLPSVVTHEIGHFFGLGHSDVVEATMFFSAAANQTALRTLHPDDIEGFCTIYGGIALQASGFDPRGGFTAECGAGAGGGGSGGGGGCRVGGGLRGPTGPGASLVLVALALATTRRRRRRRG